MISLILKHVLWLPFFIKWFIIRIISRKSSNSVTCLLGKTAIVTGGNSGIGYALSCLLASRGCRVIIADVADSKKARDDIIELTGNKNVIMKHLDLSSLDATRKFAEDINKSEKKIDILINNAGIVASTNITENKLNEVMQVNCFGPFLLTHLLIDSLKASSSARIVFQSSVKAFQSNLTLKNIDEWLNPLKQEIDNCIGIDILYSNSKFINMLLSQEFAKKLSKYNMNINSSDPGMVKTRIMNSYTNKLQELYSSSILNLMIQLPVYLFGVDQYSGAQTAFHLATSVNLLAQTGEHYYMCKKFGKPEILKNGEFCEVFWRRIEELVELKPSEKLL